MLLAMGIGVVSVWAIGSSWNVYPAHPACGIEASAPQAPDIGPPPTPGHVAVLIADSLPVNCFDAGCMMITMALPLPGGGFKICAQADAPQYWTLMADGQVAATASGTATPCFTVSSGYQFELFYAGLVDTCSKYFVIPSEYECPDSLITFAFSPGCPEVDVTIHVDESKVESVPYILTFQGIDCEPIISSGGPIVKSFPEGVFEVCITMCLEPLRFDQIITCCYTFEIGKECCDTADFEFVQHELWASCIHPRFHIDPVCKDTVYNQHIWEFSDGKVFHGINLPLPYVFTDFVNSTGEVCVTHTVICCGDTLEPVTKCLPHPTGAYLGRNGETRRLTDPIGDWADDVGHFIQLYSHDLNQPLLIDGTLILDRFAPFTYGWWHMGEEALIRNESQMFQMIGTTIQSAGRHARGYPCCRWQGVDNLGFTRTWWSGATVSDAWRMLHYPQALSDGTAPVVWSTNGYYHTNLFGIRSDIPVTFPRFVNNQLIGHRDDLAIGEGCDCTAINAIDFRRGIAGPTIDIGKATGQPNRISFYEQGFHFENFGLRARRFEVFDLEDYPPSTTLTFWNNPQGHASTGIDFQWLSNGIGLLDVDSIYIHDLHQSAARSTVAHIQVNRGLLNLQANATGLHQSIKVENALRGFNMMVQSGARISGRIQGARLETLFGGVNLRTITSMNNQLSVDHNLILNSSLTMGNYGVQLGSTSFSLPQQYRIRHNTVANASLSEGNGISVSGAQHTLIAHNTVTGGTQNAVQGIRLSNSHHSEVRCNVVENYRNGLMALGTQNAQYSANVLQGSRWNFRLAGSSAGTAGTTVRWNQLLDQVSGVPHTIYEKDGITGPQIHTMYNTWDWSGLSPETELRHENTEPQGPAFWSRYFHPQSAGIPSAHRPIRDPSVFGQQAVNNTITAVGAFCAVPSPVDPNDQQLSGPLDALIDAFTFYQDLLDADSLWISYTPAQRAALRQQIYDLLQDSTGWQTTQVFDDFLQAHISDFVGESVVLERALRNYAMRVDSQVIHLRPWMDITDSLRSLMSHYFVLAADSAYLAHQDSLLQLALDLQSDIQVFEDSIAGQQALYDSLNAIVLAELATANAAMHTTALHEDYEQMLNGLIIKQLQGANWDSTDLDLLHTIAATCYPDGGRAVWQARSILRYGYETWYEEEGCIAPLYGGSEPEVLEAVSPQWMVYPNPAQGDGWILHRGDGTVQLQSVRVLDATGRIIWQARGATEGEVSPYLPGGLWAPGVYYIEIQTARGRETMPWMIKR
jgi:hypothetical protein